MKYNYEFLDETVEIEISEEWAAVLYEFDKREYNNNHTETRRHITLDAVCYEGMIISDFATLKGISRPAATDRLKKARKKLKKHL